MTQRLVSKLIDSNVFVYENNDKVLIFDGGAELEDVKKAVGNKKVVAVFLTHGHYDHSFFALEYAKAFACKIYASQFAKEYLQDSEKNYSEGKFAVSDFSDFVFLKGDGKISLCDLEIHYFQLGGHSKSDMAFLVKDEVFVGDVLIGRDMGRIDLYGGDKNEMIKSLKRLLDCKYTTMHSGHGQDNTKFQEDKVAKLWLKFLNR